MLVGQALYYFSHSNSPFFVLSVFKEGSLNYFPSWPGTAIILISAFQADKIIGINHWHIATRCVLGNNRKNIRVRKGKKDEQSSFLTEDCQNIPIGIFSRKNDQGSAFLVV
jgi:hypothetical protein